MAGRLFFAAAVVAVHSLSPVFAEPNPQITPAPVVKRSTHHDLAKRQSYPTNTPLPLTQYQYPYSAIPEQVNPFPVGRGPQSGYNKCNSTTEGASSECQTLIVNTLADFCLWGSPTAADQPSTIGDIEAAVVAYCTQPGHGTRIIPAGSITGAQFMKTSAYIQITGHISNSGLGLQSNDSGGELDPHGADLAGNPLGGLVYSTGLPSAKNNNTELQAVEWNNFVGGGTFCIKLCDPTVTTPNYCQNIYDLIGCTYNMPNSYTDNEFTSCEGDLQDVVGTYTTNGQTITWSQPGTLGPTDTVPWTPRIPASSNCVTYSSAQLFGSATSSASGSSATVGSVTASGQSSLGSPPLQATGSTPSAGGSKTGSAAGSSSTNGASRVVVSSGLFALLGAAVVLL